MPDDYGPLEYLGKAEFPLGKTNFGMLVSSDPDDDSDIEEEMRKLIVELKKTVEEVAIENGPIRWQQAHDKRHDLYERIKKFT